MTQNLFLVFVFISLFRVAFLAEDSCVLFENDPARYVETLLDKAKFIPALGMEAIKEHFTYNICFETFVMEAFDPDDSQRFYDISKWDYYYPEKRRREVKCKRKLLDRLLDMVYMFAKANPENGEVSIEAAYMAALGRLLNNIATKGLYVHTLRMTQEEVEASLGNRVKTWWTKQFNDRLKGALKRNKKYGALVETASFRRYISMEQTLKVFMNVTDNDWIKKLNEGLSELKFADEENVAFGKSLGKIDMEILTLFLQQMVGFSKAGLFELRSIDNFSAALATPDDKAVIKSLLDFVYTGNMRRQNKEVTIKGEEMSRKIFTVYFYWIVYKVDPPFMEKYIKKRSSRRGKSRETSRRAEKPRFNLNEIPKLTLAHMIVKAKNQKLGETEQSFIDNIVQVYSEVRKDQQLCSDKIIPLQSKLDTIVENGTLNESAINKIPMVSTLYNGLLSMASTLAKNTGKAAGGLTEITKLTKALEFLLENPAVQAVLPAVPIDIPISTIQEIISYLNTLDTYGNDIKNILEIGEGTVNGKDENVKVEINALKIIKALATVAPIAAGFTPLGVPIAAGSVILKNSATIIALLMPFVQGINLFGQNNSSGDLSETVQTVLTQAGAATGKSKEAAIANTVINGVTNLASGYGARNTNVSSNSKTNGASINPTNTRADTNKAVGGYGIAPKR